MFRRIRSRLILAFAVPLALLLAVTSTAAWASFRSERSIAQETDLAIAANSPSGIVTALQNERDMAGADMIGVAGEAHLPVKSDADARQKTDKAIAAFRATVNSSGRATEQVFQPALDSLGQLSSVRWQVDSFKGAKSMSNPDAKVADVEAFNQYRQVIDNFLTAVSTAPQHISDQHLRSSVEALDLFLNQSEQLTLVAQQMFEVSILSAGAPKVTTIPGTDLGVYEGLTARLSAYTTGPDGAIVAKVIAGANQADQAMLPYVQDATAGKPFDVLGFVKAASVATADKAGDSIWTLAATEVGKDVSARSASLRHQATVRVVTYSAGALLSVLIGLLILLRVSRSISRPLTRLALDARYVAEVELPAAVDAIFNEGSAEPSIAATPREEAGKEAPRLKEVVEVAGALEDVKRKALDLATEQATLRRKVADAFVNLGRRNQNLVSRQLELITQIEQQEEDPSKLQELFRLDHLATRMRRHAESLLVIAGSGALRPWSEAASAVDVVRAASAEVEDYQRLQLHHFDHAVVAASVTTDLVHILAELMENALAFSPPHATVGLYGRALESGYTISIADAGIGMNAQAKEEANHRLASGGDLDDAASRHLGLVVAGRLAARHGIAVTLHDSEPGGVIARIRMPAELIESSVAGPADPEAPAVKVAPPAAVNGARPGPEGPRVNMGGPGSEALTVKVARTPSETPAVRPAPRPEEAAVPVTPPNPIGGLVSSGARFTSDSPLPRRVPGAALPEADDSLRRDRTPASQTPWAVSNALSDYLTNRTGTPTGRPSTEGHDDRNH